MNLVYVANIRMPTEKAHGIQIMKMCEAFSSLGHEVTLVVPKRRNHIEDDPFSYYGVRQNFQITWLPTLDTVSWGRLGFLLQTASFVLAVRRCLKTHNSDLIYSRDELVLLGLGRRQEKSVWEVHGSHKCSISRRVAARVTGIVYLTESLKRYFEHVCGIRHLRTLVAHDGVDLEKFQVPLSQKECRGKLGLPFDKKVVLYAGHLYEHKGVYTLAEAADYLPHDVEVVFVGGTQEDVERFRKYNRSRSNAHVLGHKSHADIPLYLKAADVLVLPNSSEDERSRQYTSPMKLFEYMASGVPIIASDVPSVREVVPDHLVSFVVSDDARALADQIKNVLEGDSYQQLTSASAVAKKYSWSQRAENILKCVQYEPAF